VPVDNTLYDRRPDAWWSPDGFLNFLQTGLNPARVGYFARVLTEVLAPLAGRAALDVGCGGGLLAEEVARLGLAVTGVDPSAPSLAVARDHAAESGVDIRYVRGTGEALPFGDASFDVVFCCDVLEHVASVEATVAEIARVLRPGGVFCFDTINRTWRSKVALIKAMQEWRFFAVMEGEVHDWDAFIRPAELVAAMQWHGLVSRGLVGFAPAGGPLGILRAAWLMNAQARGRLSYADVGRRIRLVESRDLSASYGGYAVKA
jgi:2-polyprenyl-6-hydroxyphenyl methylase/3-demethylubiquinone-9 3-methyltransferase